MTNTPNEPVAPEPHDSHTSGSEHPASARSATSPGGQSPWGTPPSEPASGFGTEPGPSAGPSAGSGTGTSTGTGTPPGARFFDAVRGLGIVRPDEGRAIAGVATGIARRYDVHPVVVRIAFVILTLFGGLGVALYGLGWLFLPHPDGRIHAQQVLTGTVTAGFVGALLTVLVSTHHALPLVVIALVVFLVVRHRHHDRTKHTYA